VQVPVFTGERQIRRQQSHCAVMALFALVNIAQFRTLFELDILISSGRRNDFLLGALACCNGSIDRKLLPLATLLPARWSCCPETSKRFAPVEEQRYCMMDAQLLVELAQSCRLLASHQQNPSILDMLHDLEEDFVQKARDIEGGKRQVDVGLGQSLDGGRFRPLPACRSS
jgi:hypothetical protein